MSSRIAVFARDARGSAAIEAAMGVSLLFLVAVLSYDIHSLIMAHNAVGRLAVVMGDYVSHGPDEGDTRLDGAALTALGKFSRGRILRAPADLVYVISALEQPSGDPAPDVKVLWSDATIRVGDSTNTGSLATGCSRHVKGGKVTAGKLEDFEMTAGEVLILVEVCARLAREGSLTGRFVVGGIHRQYALPSRTEETILAPVH